jgi:cell division protein FtsL
MRLFAKLFVVMLALGAMGLGLLALRQQRYEVSNEISRAHNRIVEQERAQWRMQAEIARRSDPADIRSYADRLHLDLAPVQESTAEPEGKQSVTPNLPAAGSKNKAKTRGH